MYNTILFDLDGTLTDSKIGITKSVQYALRKFDILEDDLDKLEPFIGPPLFESFMKYYGFEREKAIKAVEYYREYFSDIGIFENFVYPGVPEMLESLRAAGKKLVIATSKPAVFAERILSHFHLDRYFTLVAGSELDGRRINKNEVIGYALDLLECKDKNSFVMVGDREHDIIGASENCIDCIAVAYGYGTMEELEKAKPKHIAATVEELGEILKS